MKRPLLASFSQLFFSVIAKVSFLLVTLLLYKARSQEEMGVIALMLAIAMILATISECGMRGLLVRELARLRDEPVHATKLMAGAMKSRLYSLIPYLFSAAMLGIVLLPSTYGLQFAGILMAVWFDSNAQVSRGALRAYDRQISDAVLGAVSRVLLLAACGYMYYQSALTINGFVTAYLIVSALDFFFCQFFIYRFTSLKLSLKCSRQYTVSLVKRGMPFIVLAILGTLYLRVGVVLLGLPQTPEALRETAAFNLSGKFPEGLAFVPIALMNVAIPFLSRQSKDSGAIRSVFGRIELLAGGLGLLVSVGLIVFARELILLLSTADYLQYTMVFQLYGLTVFFSFLQHTYANLLLSMDKEHLVATRYGSILLANVILNLLLIWKFHAVGAVVALLLCEVAGVIVDLWFLRKAQICLKLSVLVKWGSIGSIAVLVAWGCSKLGGYNGLVIYGVFAAFAGATLLFFTQNSQSARDMQTSVAAD